jgi:hypothetical protein
MASCAPARAWTSCGRPQPRTCPRPHLRPDHSYYDQVKDRKNSKHACLSEARKILRQAHHILTELGDDALAAA